MSPVSPELSLWVFLKPSKGMPTIGQLRKEHTFLENADNVHTHTHTRLGMGPLHSVFCATINSSTQEMKK